MDIISNTRISTRLALSFAFMALLVTLLAGGSYLNMRTVNEAFHVLIDDRYEKISELNDIKDKVSHMARSMSSALLLAGTEEAKVEIEEVATARKRVGETLKKLEGQALDAEARVALGAVLEARGKFSELQDRFVEQLNAGKADEARALLLGDGRKLQIAYFNRLDTLIEHESGAMAESVKAANGDIDRMLLLSWTTGVAALVSAAVLAWLAIRSVTRPLHRAVEATHAIANGDLTVEIEARGRNEMAQLLTSLRDMQSGLAQVVSNVRGNAESVAAASTQISQGNHHLSGRTEEQASALQQTAASMKQLAQTVKQNAGDAEQASQLAVGASGVATKGGALMEEVVQTMKGINESSRRIADIIGVIDGIAFQTNILALNAAVEAARAGEQGRGFAVVAGEVRTLAQRSAEAAKEIKDLITASVERAEQGSSLVDKAGTTMSEVVGSIQRVSDLMARINRASQEQSAGVAQIGEAVAQMDQATQQNAALVEESAAAAESLKAQSQDLVNAVSVFRVAGVQRVQNVQAVQHVQNTQNVQAMQHVQRLAAPAIAAPAQPRPSPAPAPAKAPVADRPAVAAATADDEWTTF